MRTTNRPRRSACAAVLSLASLALGCGGGLPPLPPPPPDAAREDTAVPPPDVSHERMDAPGDRPDDATTSPDVRGAAPDADDAWMVDDRPTLAPDAPDVACAMGQARCDDACVTTASDRAHCGACGRACSGTMYCESGTCRPPTLTGAFVSAGVSANTGTTELRGVMTWHAAVRGTHGGVTLEGWLR